MIDFFFRHRPIHLDCFTASVNAYKFAPIEPANRFIPDWWKAIPKTHTNDGIEMGTMKTCAGFIDLYGKGVMLPMWSELVVRLQEDGYYQYNFGDLASSAEFHNPAQVGTLLEKFSAIHLKIHSPWLFECKESVSWHFAHPVWNQAAMDYCVLTGVVDYKYSTSTNINVLFRRTNNVVTFEHGDPLAHIIPLSERPLRIKNHLISQEEYDKKYSINKPISYRGGYYRKKKLIEARESKCPFGFGGK
jgi:hypothetical protein